MQKKNIVIILSVLLVFCVAGLSYVISVEQERSAGARPAFTTPLDMGGDFTLTNQEGEKISTFVYKDKYKLVYFGFTSCPAICPTELQKMVSALKMLGQDGIQIQPIFVTVDPDRDTVKTLKDYVPLFSKELVGFTGTKQEIEAVKKQYRVYAAKVEDKGASDYSVDHSSYIYLLNRDSKVIDLYKTEDGAGDMAKRIRAALKDA